MIFLDSNVAMYLVGSDHPHKYDAQRLLDTAVLRRERLITDAEVLQEVLHRYSAIHRHDAVQPTLDLLLSVTDEVISIDRDIVVRAKDIVLSGEGISARDAVHVAAMEVAGARTIMSFDRDFDRFPDIVRLS